MVLDRVIDIQWGALDRINTFTDCLNEMGQKLHLPEAVLEKARVLFKPVNGLSKEAVYAACMYMACRQGVPRKRSVMFTSR